MLGHLHLSPSQASHLRGRGPSPTLLIFAHLKPKVGLPEDNSDVNHHLHIKMLLNAVYQRLCQTPQGNL